MASPTTAKLAWADSECEEALLAGGEPSGIELTDEQCERLLERPDNGDTPMDVSAPVYGPSPVGLIQPESVSQEIDPSELEAFRRFQRMSRQELAPVTVGSSVNSPVITRTAETPLNKRSGAKAGKGKKPAVASGSRVDRKPVLIVPEMGTRTGVLAPPGLQPLPVLGLGPPQPTRNDNDVHFGSYDYRYFHPDGTKRSEPELDSPPRVAPKKTRTKLRTSPRKVATAVAKHYPVPAEDLDEVSDGERVTDRDDPIADGCRAAMLLCFQQEGIQHPDLGYAIDMREESDSEWIVRARGGGPIKLGKHLQSINSGLTQNHICTEYNDPIAPAGTFEDWISYGGTNRRRLVLPRIVEGDHKVSDDEAWLDEGTQPLQWYVDRLTCLMFQVEEQAGYTKTEIACLKLVRRVFRPGQTCMFCDPIAPPHCVGEKLYLRWRQLARHIVEYHLHDEPRWECLKPPTVADSKAGCPSFRTRGKPFQTMRRGVMVRHLLSYGMPGHARSHERTIGPITHMFWNRQEETKRMQNFSVVSRNLPLGKESLMIPYKFRMVALALHAPHEREYVLHLATFGYGRGGRARGRGPRTRARGRGAQSTRTPYEGSDSRAGAPRARGGTRGRGRGAVGRKPTEKTTAPKGKTVKTVTPKVQQEVAPKPPGGSAKDAKAWPILPEPEGSPKKKRTRPRKRGRSPRGDSSSETPAASGDPEPSTSVVWQGVPTSLGKTPRRVTATVTRGDSVSDATLVPSGNEAAKAGTSRVGPGVSGEKCAKVRIVDHDVQIDLGKLVAHLDAKHAARTTEKIRTCVEGLVDIFVGDYQDSTRRSMNLAVEKVSKSDADLLAGANAKLTMMGNQLAVMATQRREAVEKLANAEMKFEAIFGTKLDVWSGSADELNFDRLTVERRLRGLNPALLESMQRTAALTECRRSPQREPLTPPPPAPSLDSLRLTSPPRHAVFPPREGDVPMPGEDREETTLG